MGVNEIDFANLSAAKGLSRGLKAGAQLGNMYRQNRLQDSELERKENERMIDDMARDAYVALQIQDPKERDEYLAGREKWLIDNNKDPSHTQEIRLKPFSEQTNELKYVLTRAMPASSLTKNKSGQPSRVQEYEYFTGLGKDEQKDYMNLVRGKQIVTYGDVQGYIDPLTNTFVAISEGGEETTSEVQSNIDETKSKQTADKLNQEAKAASEQEFKKQIGAEGAKVYSTLQKSAQSASAFIPRLQSLRDLAYKVETGTGAEIKLAAKKALGIDSADMEELNAKLGELAQDILNQQTGTKTDFDFENAVRQSASLGKSQEANSRLINALIARQQQAVYFADQARKAYDKNGVKGVLDMRYSAPNDSAVRVNENQQALEWARQNPSDPRAAQIMQMVGQ